MDGSRRQRRSVPDHHHGRAGVLLVPRPRDAGSCCKGISNQAVARLASSWGRGSLAPSRFRLLWCSSFHWRTRARARSMSAAPKSRSLPPQGYCELDRQDAARNIKCWMRWLAPWAPRYGSSLPFADCDQLIGLAQGAAHFPPRLRLPHRRPLRRAPATERGTAGHHARPGAPAAQGRRRSDVGRVAEARARPHRSSGRAPLRRQRGLLRPRHRGSPLPEGRVRKSVELGAMDLDQGQACELPAVRRARRPGRASMRCSAASGPTWTG